MVRENFVENASIQIELETVEGISVRIVKAEPGSIGIRV